MTLLTTPATVPGNPHGRGKRGLPLSLLIAVLILGACMVIVQLVAKPDPPPAGRPLTTVHVIAGSESLPLLTDRRFEKALARHGLRLDVTPEGSQQIASDAGTCAYDLALPSSDSIALAAYDHCQGQDSRIRSTYPVFSSPMVVATFQDIVPLLVTLHVAHRDPADGTWVFSVRNYVHAVERGVRWDTIRPNNTYTYSHRLFLLTTTNIATSNSAAMYAAILSYLFDGSNPVADTTTAMAQAPEISRLFFQPQGQGPSSTLYGFNDYLNSLGEATAPMNLVYEAQYLDVELNHPELIRQDHLVVMYPDPTAVAIHTAVPMNDKGDLLGQYLSGADHDPQIIRLEAQFGWRTNDLTRTFQNVTASRHIVTKADIDPAPLPNYRQFEALLTGIQEATNGH